MSDFRKEWAEGVVCRWAADRTGREVGRVEMQHDDARHWSDVTYDDEWFVVLAHHPDGSHTTIDVDFAQAMLEIIELANE